MAVALKDEKKAEFNQIQQELSALGTNFSNNVLDATKAFRCVSKQTHTCLL
jgi:oligopeptidase A